MSDEPKEINSQLPDPTEIVDAPLQKQISEASQLLSGLSESEKRLIAAALDVINNMERSLEALGNAFLRIYREFDPVQPMLAALKQLSENIAKMLQRLTFRNFQKKDWKGFARVIGNGEGMVGSFI